MAMIPTRKFEFVVPAFATLLLCTALVWTGCSSSSNQSQVLAGPCEALTACCTSAQTSYCKYSSNNGEFSEHTCAQAFQYARQFNYCDAYTYPGYDPTEFPLASSPDGGIDASALPDSLSGEWMFSTITCAGSTAPIGPSSQTLTFAAGSYKSVTTLRDGCVETTEFDPDTVTATSTTSGGQVVFTEGEITWMSSSNTCSDRCTSADECREGSVGGTGLYYTISEGTLAITYSVPTSSCASGTAIASYTMD